MQLGRYLAIGLTPKDIEWVIVDAMKAEMKARKSNTEAVKHG